MKPVRIAAAAGLLLAIGAGGFGAASLGVAASAASSNGHRKDIPVATPNGPAVHCIPIVSIQESQVRDDWTIDFRTSGNRWYRNTLPNRCNSLGFERAFSYATSLSQLCNTDIITVFANGATYGPRGSCGLGDFQPVELARKAK